MNAKKPSATSNWFILQVQYKQNDQTPKSDLVLPISWVETIKAVIDIQTSHYEKGATMLKVPVVHQ